MIAKKCDMFRFKLKKVQNIASAVRKKLLPVCAGNRNMNYFSLLSWFVVYYDCLDADCRFEYDTLEFATLTGNSFDAMDGEMEAMLGNVKRFAPPNVRSEQWMVSVLQMANVHAALWPALLEMTGEKDRTADG